MRDNLRRLACGHFVYDNPKLHFKQDNIELNITKNVVCEQSFDIVSREVTKGVIWSSNERVKTIDNMSVMYGKDTGLVTHFKFSSHCGIVHGSSAGLHVTFRNHKRQYFIRIGRFVPVKCIVTRCKERYTTCKQEHSHVIV